MDQQQVKKRSQGQMISSEDELDVSEPPKKRLKIQLCANNMNSPSLNNVDSVQNIGSDNTTSNSGMMSPEQGGPNEGNFYANIRMIDIEVDEELMKNCMQRIKHLKILLEII